MIKSVLGDHLKTCAVHNRTIPLGTKVGGKRLTRKRNKPRQRSTGEDAADVASGWPDEGYRPDQEDNMQTCISVTSGQVNPSAGEATYPASLFRYFDTGVKAIGGSLHFHPRLFYTRVGEDPNLSEVQYLPGFLAFHAEDGDTTSYARVFCYPQVQECRGTGYFIPGTLSSLTGESLSQSAGEFRPYIPTLQAQVLCLTEEAVYMIQSVTKEALGTSSDNQRPLPSSQIQNSQVERNGSNNIQQSPSVSQQDTPSGVSQSLPHHQVGSSSSPSSATSSNLLTTNDARSSSVNGDEEVQQDQYTVLETAKRPKGTSNDTAQEVTEFGVDLSVKDGPFLSASKSSNCQTPSASGSLTYKAVLDCSKNVEERDTEKPISSERNILQTFTSDERECTSHQNILTSTCTTSKNLDTVNESTTAARVISDIVESRDRDWSTVPHTEAPAHYKDEHVHKKFEHDLSIMKSSTMEESDDLARSVPVQAAAVPSEEALRQPHQSDNPVLTTMAADLCQANLFQFQATVRPQTHSVIDVGDFLTDHITSDSGEGVEQQMSANSFEQEGDWNKKHSDAVTCTDPCALKDYKASPQTPVTQFLADLQDEELWPPLPMARSLKNKQIVSSGPDIAKHQISVDHVDGQISAAPFDHAEDQISAGSGKDMDQITVDSDAGTEVKESTGAEIDVVDNQTRLTLGGEDKAKIPALLMQFEERAPTATRPLIASPSTEMAVQFHNERQEQEQQGIISFSIGSILIEVPASPELSSTPPAEEPSSSALMKLEGHIEGCLESRATKAEFCFDPNNQQMWPLISDSASRTRRKTNSR